MAAAGTFALDLSGAMDNGIQAVAEARGMRVVRPVAVEATCQPVP